MTNIIRITIEHLIYFCCYCWCSVRVLVKQNGNTTTLYRAKLVDAVDSLSFSVAVGTAVFLLFSVVPFSIGSVSTTHTKPNINDEHCYKTDYCRYRFYY